MATSRQAAQTPAIPAIPTPAALELRQVQSAIDNIREGLQRLQARINQTTLEVGETRTQVAKGSGNVVNLRAKVLKLEDELEDLSRLVLAGTGASGATVLRLMLGADGEDGEDGQSIPGPRGELPLYVEFPAATALGGNRAVRLVAGEATYADNASVADANLVLGITRGAVVLGDIVQIQVTGLMTEPSWAWTSDAPVFVGAAGVLTQTSPSTGYTLIVGIATSPTQILIGARMPIVVV